MVAAGLAALFPAAAHAAVVCEEVPVLGDRSVILEVCFDGTNFSSAAVRVSNGSFAAVVSVTMDHTLNLTTVCVHTSITDPDLVCVTIPVSVDT